MSIALDPGQVGKRSIVRLFDFLDRSEVLEERAAALYRAFAAARRDDPELAALWTALAADEDAHARSVREARSRLDSHDGALTSCRDPLARVRPRLDSTRRETFDVTEGPSKSGRPGSNRRRPAWEAGILPLNYARKLLACKD